MSIFIYQTSISGGFPFFPGHIPCMQKKGRTQQYTDTHVYPC